MEIRDATEADAAACAAVYAPYVRDTAITFEVLPAPTPRDFAARIADAQRQHAWLVATDDDGRVFGYAYGGPYMERAAYRWACTVSVYLEPGRRRTGAGRALYTHLFERLTERGFLTAIAGMTEPNAASEGLHRAMGFTPVGTYARVGFKDGAWHDVTWFQRPLGDGPRAGAGQPPEPR